MGISSYQKNNKKLWKVYVHLRSKVDRSIRFQSTVSDLPSMKDALKEEKRLIRDLSLKISKREGKGLDWSVVIERWSEAALSGYIGSYNKSTVIDYRAALLTWTEDWLSKPANTISRADAKFKLRSIEKKNKNPRPIKVMINTVYNYGMEEGLIKGVDRSPVYGIKIKNNSCSKSPDVLSIDDIRRFLAKAKSCDHPWYPVWLLACTTGMRNGELFALKWKDLLIDWNSSCSKSDIIRVSRSYNKRNREMKSTKAGYWRNVPVSSELKSFLIEFRKKGCSDNESFVLPRLTNWERGYQAQVLRLYLSSINIAPIKFHALRACFATILLSEGTPAPLVMKICGWKDLKTMEYYVRVAGLNEKGATDCLKLTSTSLN